MNATSAPKRMTRLSSGKLFDKDLFIWCLEPDESIKKKKKISICFLSPRTKEVMETYVWMHTFLNR